MKVTSEVRKPIDFADAVAMASLSAVDKVVDTRPARDKEVVKEITGDD